VLGKATACADQEVPAAHGRVHDAQAQDLLWRLAFGQRVDGAPDQELDDGTVGVVRAGLLAAHGRPKENGAARNGGEDTDRFSRPRGRGFALFAFDAGILIFVRLCFFVCFGLLVLALVAGAAFLILGFFLPLVLFSASIFNNPGRFVDFAPASGQVGPLRRCQDDISPVHNGAPLVLGRNDRGEGQQGLVDGAELLDIEFPVGHPQFTAAAAGHPRETLQHFREGAITPAQRFQVGGLVGMP